MPTCTKCKSQKTNEEFSKSKTRKSGFRSYCKICEQTDRMIWYRANKSKAKATCAAYYQSNKTEIKVAVRERSKKRRKQDINYRLTINLRRRLNNALHGNNKSKKTLALLGCTIEALKQYLSSKFEQGMTWDNYGKWHIDHVIPCCKFDLSKAEQQEQCFHYSNLQPLWAKDNLMKSGNITFPTPTSSYQNSI